MKITCPGCGEIIIVNGLGRKTLDVPVENIFNALSTGKTITTIASELNCSRATIYLRVKEYKMEVIRRKVNGELSL
jgi:DNA invertase Pin-like site-specific DNA recombinase